MAAGGGVTLRLLRGAVLERFGLKLLELVAPTAAHVGDCGDDVVVEPVVECRVDEHAQELDVVLEFVGVGCHDRGVAAAATLKPGNRLP